MIRERAVLRRAVVVGPPPSRRLFVAALPLSALGFLYGLLLVDPLAPRAVAPLVEKRPAYVENELIAVAHERPPERSIGRAVDWLHRHQYPDGSWDSRTFFQLCTPAVNQHVCLQGGQPEHNLGLTALSALAMLESGIADASSSDPRRDDVRASCGRALRWLTGRMDASGCVGPRAGRYLYGHAISTLAFCRAYDVLADDPMWKHWARRATQYLVNARQPDGAWGYGFRSGEANMSVTAWAAAALDAARRIHVGVDEMDPWASRQLTAWVDSLTDPDTFRVSYTRGHRGPAHPRPQDPYERNESATAAALVVRSCIGARPEAAEIRGGVTMLSADLPFWPSDSATVDFCHWYFGTRALLAIEGSDGSMYRAWAARTLRALADHQTTFYEGCGNGSWKPVDRWGNEGGRIYSTAMGALTLGVIRRSLPTPGE